MTEKTKTAVHPHRIRKNTRVLLDRIKIDDDLKVRAISESFLKLLVDSPDPRFTPVVLDERKTLVDGFHRLEAARRKGLTALCADIYRYPNDTIRLLHAIRLNSRHGLQLSSEQRQELAVKLYRSDLPMNDIVDALGVSTRTARRWTAKCRGEERGRQDKKIKEMSEAGHSERHIARKLRVGRRRVKAVVPNGHVSERNQQTKAPRDSQDGGPAPAEETFRVGKNRVRLVYGVDVLAALRRLPDASVHSVVTSPPYWSQRDYGTGRWKGGDQSCHHRMETMGSGGKRSGSQPRSCVLCGAHFVDEQIGHEETPEQFVDRMVEAFREVRRVLRDDGTLWLNAGDGYVGSGFSGKNRAQMSAIGREGTGATKGPRARWRGLPLGNLIGTPWRLALALQKDGWILRSDIIWSKPNPFPDTSHTRPNSAHEHVFMLTKTKNDYYYDKYFAAEKSPNKRSTRDYRFGLDVWTIGVSSSRSKHVAMMSDELAEKIIRIGSCREGVCAICGRPKKRCVLPATYEQIQVHNPFHWIHDCQCPGGFKPGTVLDPFCGSGTTGRFAVKHGQDFIGVDLNADYLGLAKKRIQGEEEVNDKKKPKGSNRNSKKNKEVTIFDLFGEAEAG